MTFNELMKFHRDNEMNYKGIQEAYSRNKLVPFVGAGLCIPPYKGWGDALRQMCSSVPNAVPELERHLANGNYEQAAAHVYNALRIARFTRAFREEFSSEKIAVEGLSQTMELLPQIFTGLVFTTNYDRCLETSYSNKGQSFDAVYSIRDSEGYQDIIDQTLRNQPHKLFKLHGDIDNISGRVLLEEEYDKLYAEDGPFTKLLSQFFLYKQFLFLGCSMTGTDRYMQVLKQIANRHTIPNYAILPTLKKNESETEEDYQKRVDKWEALLSDHWIFPVFYPADDYTSVTELLKELNATTQINKDKNAVHVTGFFGRSTIVRDIQEQLKTHNSILLHGVGGIGKTQICEEIVSQFEGDAVKIYLQGVNGYFALLQSMCNALGLNSVNNNKDDNRKKQAILENIRLRSANNPFLLYLDNFEDVLLQKDSSILAMEETDENIDPAVEWITELMSCNVHQFYLLISSRDILIGFPSKRVTPLDNTSMVMLFQRVFCQSGGQQEQLLEEADAVTQLIDHLSGHPLAAVLAASQVTVSGSVQRILDSWNATGNPRVNVAIDQNPTHKALRTALLVSYKQIGMNDDAKLLWGFLSLVSQDLPIKLAKLLLPDTYLNAERCLITLSLAELNRQGNGLSMLEPIKHQAFAYNSTTEAECLMRLTEVYDSLISECLGDQSKWHLAVELTGDILYCLNYLIRHKSERNYEMLKRLLINGRSVNNLLVNQPRTGLAFIEKIFADNSFFNSFEDEAKAILYEGRAECQFFCFLHSDAMDNYNMARKLYEKLGMKSRIASTLYSEGEIEYWNDNYVEAERLYLDAKKIYEETNDDDGLANVLMRLGVLYHQLAKCESVLKIKAARDDQAFVFLDRARQNAERSRGKHIIANIYFYLGEYYSDKPNKKQKALGYYRKASELYLIEHDNLGQGNTYASIGDIYSVSNPKLALVNYQRAILCFKENEIPESYYSRISRRITECNRLLEGKHPRELNIDVIIAEIDRKIAELEASQADKSRELSDDASDNKPK